MGAFAHLFGMLQNRISGSGKFWRDRSERAIAENAAQYDIPLTVDPPPPGFTPDDLGGLLLVFFEDEDATLLNVRSAMPGNDMKWRGLPLLHSPMIQKFGFDNELDLQRFLNYVYNFKNILFSTRTGKCWPAHPNDVDRIIYGEMPLPDMSLLKEALGSR